MRPRPLTRSVAYRISARDLRVLDRGDTGGDLRFRSSRIRIRSTGNSNCRDLSTPTDLPLVVDPAQHQPTSRWRWRRLRQPASDERPSPRKAPPRELRLRVEPSRRLQHRLDHGGRKAPGRDKATGVESIAALSGLHQPSGARRSHPRRRRRQPQSRGPYRRAIRPPRSPWGGGRRGRAASRRAPLLVTGRGRLLLVEAGGRRRERGEASRAHRRLPRLARPASRRGVNAGRRLSAEVDGTLEAQAP